MPALPSLKGLQAFEVAARQGSFAAAAEELSVSPAAVSQLIRSLEDQIGRKLFHRVKRGIALTEAGREVLPRLSTVFDELQGVSRQLAGTGGRSRITISVPPSVAVGWLSARIARFVAEQEPGNISIRGEEDPVAFERHSIDIRMSYGRFHYREYESEAIVTDVAFPVCSPDFLVTHGPFESARQLLGVPLIHTDWGPAAATFPTWRGWFDAVSVPQERRADGDLTANSSKAAIDLAIAGLGVVLCQGFFAAQPIDDGLLVRPLEQSLALSQAYCLTVPQRSAARPIVQAFKAWFVEECRAALVASEQAAL